MRLKWMRLMKKWTTMIITLVLALALSVSCTPDVQRDISDLVTMKEVVNKEVVRTDGSTGRYIYELPIINIDKPGAKKVNDMFLDLEQYMENSIGGLQNYTLVIKPKAALNDGVVSIVMDAGAHGIYAANYEIESDKALSTKELLAKFKFDPNKLVAEINRQSEIDDSKPEDEQYYRGGLLDLFAYTILENTYPDVSQRDEHLRKVEIMTKEERETFVRENVSQIEAYINKDGKVEFIHTGLLDDEVLVVQ